jgi:ATP/maltotriose-dependent transcriptional regulator MalT
VERFLQQACSAASSGRLEDSYAILIPCLRIGATLSQREIGILQMIAHGMSNKRIAQSLGITPETVKSHAKSIFFKLATRTRAQAVARAEAIGLLS